MIARDGPAAVLASTDTNSLPGGQPLHQARFARWGLALVPVPAVGHGRTAVTDRGFANAACPNARPNHVAAKGAATLGS